MGNWTSVKRPLLFGRGHLFTIPKWVPPLFSPLLSGHQALGTLRLATTDCGPVMLLLSVVTCFHPPNWHFPLSGSNKTFHFSYLKFLYLLKFLFIKVQVSSIFKEKKKFRKARGGFDLRAWALQCITLTPTPPRISLQWMVIETTLTLTLCTNH